MFFNQKETINALRDILKELIKQTELLKEIAASLAKRKRASRLLFKLGTPVPNTPIKPKPTPTSTKKDK